MVLFEFVKKCRTLIKSITTLSKKKEEILALLVARILKCLACAAIQYFLLSFGLWVAFWDLLLLQSLVFSARGTPPSWSGTDIASLKVPQSVRSTTIYINLDSPSISQ